MPARAADGWRMGCGVRQPGRLAVGSGPRRAMGQDLRCSGAPGFSTEKIPAVAAREEIVPTFDGGQVHELARVHIGAASAISVAGAI